MNSLLKIQSHIAKMMKRQSNLLVAILYSLLFEACITPLDTDPSDFDDYIVVQGFITDDFGPHRIRISRVAQFSGVEDAGEIKIEDAEVCITDNTGESVTLRRISGQRKFLLGNNNPPCFTSVDFSPFTTDYLTPETFRGRVGNVYTLEIVASDGKVYHSEPQTIRATPPIDTVLVEFRELPSLNPSVPGSGIEIFSSWQDPPEEDNFYFWRLNGTYRIHTPDRSGPGRCCRYDPRDGLSEICWIVERNLRGNRLSFSDQMTNGERVTLPVGLIEDDGLRFNSALLSAERKYYVEVEQYMITEEDFEFIDRISTLGSINGEVFDPPPLSITRNGNIFNVEDPDEVVIGRFGAYSVQKKGVFVPKSLFRFTQRFPAPCGDCRLRTGAQLETPEPFLD